MSYAGQRRILDADSHLMELPGFLDRHIEPALLDRLKNREMASLASVLDEAVNRAGARKTDAATAKEAEERLLLDKGWMAIGAFDRAERSKALDLLGFEQQLVFATFASAMYSGTDIERLYAGSRAQNRAVAEFCADDPRLLAVAFVPLVDPEEAVASAREAIDLGSGALHIPSTAAGNRSPTHPDLHPFWALLEESGLPFVLHVGGGGRLLDPAYHNNGMPVTDHLGGGENIRSKDYLGIYHSSEAFLGALILDGLFDRFPGLRGASVEQGAGWVVSWLRHLDYARRAFRRTEEPLRQLRSEPSEYVYRHLKFTPFPGEPVGWMMEQTSPDLFMFSSDYPHPEGGRDPIAKFEETLNDTDEDAKDRFYAGNMAELLGTPA